MSLRGVFEAARERQEEVIVVMRGGRSHDGVVESVTDHTVTLRRRSSPGFSPCPAVIIVTSEIASVTEVP